MKNQRDRRNARANQSLAFLAGLLLGSLTGAVVMLLMAPRAGKKTRSQLQKQGATLHRHTVEGLEEAGDKVNEFTDSVGHEAGKLQKNAHDLISVGKK